MVVGGRVMRRRARMGVMQVLRVVSRRNVLMQTATVVVVAVGGCNRCNGSNSWSVRMVMAVERGRRHG